MRKLNLSYWTEAFDDEEAPCPPELREMLLRDSPVSVWDAGDGAAHAELITVGLACGWKKLSQQVHLALVDAAELERLGLQVRVVEDAAVAVPSIADRHREIPLATANDVDTFVGAVRRSDRTVLLKREIEAAVLDCFDRGLIDRERCSPAATTLLDRERPRR